MQKNYLKSLSPIFQIFLLIIAVIYAVVTATLIIYSSEAAPATGRVPSLAISLVSEVNTGILAPNEQRWFKLTQHGAEANGQVEQALTVFFTPNSSLQQQQVSLQLFDENQLPNFYDGHSDQMVNFGAGQLVSRDGNPQSGELLWTGWLLDGQSFYVQLRNDGALPIDYWLLTDDVSIYPEVQAEIVAEDTEAGLEMAPVIELAAAITDGGSPQTAIPLLSGRNTGHVLADQQIWYSFSAADQAPSFFEEMALTMFVTPNTEHQIENVSFEIFTAEAAQQWSAQGTSELNNMGAGSLIQRDNDPLTGERFWTGWVVDSDIYYLRIHNHTATEIDYWLFDGDIYNPSLGD